MCGDITIFSELHKSLLNGGLFVFRRNVGGECGFALVNLGMVALSSDNCNYSLDRANYRILSPLRSPTAPEPSHYHTFHNHKIEHLKGNHNNKQAYRILQTTPPKRFLQRRPTIRPASRCLCSFCRFFICSWFACWFVNLLPFIDRWSVKL